MLVHFLFVFGVGSLFFWDFSRVQVREPPSASVISGRKTVRESGNQNSRLARAMRITRFCLTYVLEDLTPSGFEIFVFKTHARPTARSQLRNRALDFKNGISLPSERNFARACVLRFAFFFLTVNT